MEFSFAQQIFEVFFSNKFWNSC